MYTVQTSVQYFGPAEVLDTMTAEGRVLLQFHGDDSHPPEWARMALPFFWQPRIGETVLAAGSLDELFVIGVLGTSPAERCTRVQTGSGAFAEIAGAPDAESVNVYSTVGDLLFQYQPQHGVARVIGPADTLEFVSRGEIRFSTPSKICFDAGVVQLNARHGLRMIVGSALEKVASSLSMLGGRIRVAGSDLNVAAARGDFQINDAKVTGEFISARARYVRLAASRLETVADRVVHTANDVFQTVKGLTQIRSGRMRTIVGSTFHLLSKRSYLKSKEDFKVKGDKIHLG